MLLPLVLAQKAATGTVVSISGVGFDSGSSVSFDGVKATSVTPSAAPAASR
jgi:hypothetical protein